MFLHQRLNYNFKFVKSVDELKEFFAELREKPPFIAAYDTETTGLNIGLDKPFLMSVGYRNNVAAFELNGEMLKVFLEHMKLVKFTVAHNAKYDFHMINNIARECGIEIPRSINFADSIHFARLSEFSDVMQSLSLEALGKKYVVGNAKFGADFIRDELKELRKTYKDVARIIYNDAKIDDLAKVERRYKANLFKAERTSDIAKRIKAIEKAENDYKREKFIVDILSGNVLDLFKDVEEAEEIKSRVNLINCFMDTNFNTFFKLFSERDKWDINGYVERAFKDELESGNASKEGIKELFAIFEKILREPNYYDVYLKEPSLMINYAADDVVILLEYLRKIWKVITVVDPNYKLTMVECNLLRASARAEREGVYVDVEYLIKSKNRLEEYLDDKYKTLYELTGRDFTVNQDAVIKELYYDLFKVELPNSQKDTLDNIEDYIPKGHPNRERAVTIGKLIANMRSVNKSLSTSIIGKLNQQVGGVIYLDTNNNGTVTGRVSNDMQQYPSGDTLGFDGEVLFSPRKMVIAPKDYHIVSIDFSQMEIRGQAQYTLDIGKPDETMLRAVMPYKHVSKDTGEAYNKWEHDLDSGEWIDPNTGEAWAKVDLHGAMARNAFPEIDPNTPEFKDTYREYAKRANFLIIYGGGVGALRNAIGVDYDTARSLAEGFSKTFPEVRSYQKWVEQNLMLNKYVTNFFGRRYYFQQPQTYGYKAVNYLIQGGTAYAFKERQAVLDKYLIENKLKSRMVMPIHDEMMYYVHKDELHIIEDLQAIMEHIECIKDVPMVAEVDYSKTSWADLEPYKTKRKRMKDVRFGD